MDDNGWVKLYRDTLKSSVFQKPIIWYVWSWCLMKARHEQSKFPFNGNDMIIQPGQFVTGRHKALRELKISEQNYKTAVKYLKLTGRITSKVTNQFSLITIVNWSKYQSGNQQTNQQTNQPLTSHSPATNHIQESKERKELKNNNGDENEKIKQKLVKWLGGFEKINSPEAFAKKILGKYRAAIIAKALSQSICTSPSQLYMLLDHYNSGGRV